MQVLAESIWAFSTIFRRLDGVMALPSTPLFGGEGGDVLLGVLLPPSEFDESVLSSLQETRARMLKRIKGAFMVGQNDGCEEILSESKAGRPVFLFLRWVV